MASKLQERIFVEGFLKRCPDPMSLIAERESPDFLMRDDKGELGLEVAQVFRTNGRAGSPAKAAASRRAKYLKGLASAYYRTGGLPLLVKATLPHRPDYDVEALSRRLQVERADEPWDRTSFVLSPSTKFHLTALPAEAGIYNRWLCINNSLGWVGRLDSKLLASRIQAKAAKISEYRKKAERIGLLLVVDGTCESGMLQWPADEPPPDPEGFDLVYLYIHPDEVFRLE
jgi:hypothetical protein